MPELPLNFDTLLKLSEPLLGVVVILLLLGLVLLLLSLRRLFKKRIISGGLQALSGTSLSLAGLLLLSVAMNFYSYDRLTHEQTVAELKFKQIDQQVYQLDILYPDSDRPDSFTIHGDEWQVDARIIKWKGWAQLLGLDAQYRLERVSGRYDDIEQERQQTRSVYSLAPDQKPDYWQLIRDYQAWIPWVDAYYGSATYLPMADNSHYLLSMSQTGLIARPMDLDTERLIRQC
mgnify:CR=1 FL=1